MSSTGPSRANAYQFPSGPSKAFLTKALWNLILGDIDARLVAFEEKGTELDDLIADLSFTAQTRVDETITPIIAATRDELVLLRAAAAAAVQAAADAADEVSTEVAARVAALESKLPAVEAEFNRILGSGLAAGKVSLTAITGLVASNVQAAIAEIAAAGLNTIQYEVRTTNSGTIGAAHKATWFDYAPTVAFGQTTSTAAAMRSGWWAILRNIGTANVSWNVTDGGVMVLQPGDVRLVQSDGTARRSILIVDGQIDNRSRRRSFKSLQRFGS